MAGRAILGLLWGGGTAGALVSAFAGAAAAEGATQIYDCQVRHLCDGLGACAASQETVTFRLSPLDVAQDGAGTYQIAYRYGGAERTAQGRRIGWLGPTLWGTSQNGIDAQDSLMATQEGGFLWHSLALSDPPTSMIRFLECEAQL